AVMAHAIQSDLFESGIREHRGIWVYVFFLLSVAIVLLVGSIRPPKLSACLNIAGIPLLSLAFSYGAFRTFYHWFDFVPILTGAIVLQRNEQAIENLSARV